MDYIDLYLIHTPTPFKVHLGASSSCDSGQTFKSNNCFQAVEGTYNPLFEDGKLVPELIDHLETWRALESLSKKGVLKVNLFFCVIVVPLQLRVEITWSANV